MMLDFYYNIKYKIKIIKHSFEKDRLYFLNERIKINKRSKNEIIRTLWKIEKTEQFS